MPLPAVVPPVTPTALKLRILADQVDHAASLGLSQPEVIAQTMPGFLDVADDYKVGEAHVIAALRDGAAASTALAGRVRELEGRAEAAAPIIERSVVAHEREAQAAAKAAEAAASRPTLAGLVSLLGPEGAKYLLYLALALGSGVAAQRCGVTLPPLTPPPAIDPPPASPTPGPADPEPTQ